MKSCSYCWEGIKEDEKFCMHITKNSGKIVEFEAFHFECWKVFWRELIEGEAKERKRKNH